MLEKQRFKGNMLESQGKCLRCSIAGEILVYFPLLILQFSLSFLISAELTLPWYLTNQIVFHDPFNVKVLWDQTLDFLCCMCVLLLTNAHCTQQLLDKSRRGEKLNRAITKSKFSVSRTSPVFQLRHKVTVSLIPPLLMHPNSKQSLRSLSYLKLICHLLSA